MTNNELKSFIAGMPKAELHLHFDGTLEPERMLQLAEKNKVKISYDSIEEIEKAYQFTDLQSFLDLLYEGAAVINTAEDFYTVTMDYLKHCRAENVVHTEISFDPQTHTERGLAFGIMIEGITGAMEDAKRDWGQSSLLIMSFLRHLSEESAEITLEASLPFRDKIVAVGLDSSEFGHPPSKFKRVFARARAQGLLGIAHAGEEGPPAYIHEALDLLKVQRIDHGVRAIEDPELMTTLAAKQIPLTVCPLSNVRLCVFDTMADHNILTLLDAGLNVSVNSDDPTYFGGYVNANFDALVTDLQLTQDQAVRLARNSFSGSFLPEGDKSKMLDRLSEYATG